MMHRGHIGLKIMKGNDDNLGNQQYIFCVLRPNDYPEWFTHLRTGAFVFDLTSGTGGLTKVDDE
jgi:hypothetical protein